jgi:uncharacterized membrane protein
LLRSSCRLLLLHLTTLAALAGCQVVSAPLCYIVTVIFNIDSDAELLQTLAMTDQVLTVISLAAVCIFFLLPCLESFSWRLQKAAAAAAAALDEGGAEGSTMRSQADAGQPANTAVTRERTRSDHHRQSVATTRGYVY